MSYELNFRVPRFTALNGKKNAAVCGFDLKTEVLTLDGWKRAIDLDPFEQVAVFAPKEKNITFQYPIRVTKDFFKGDLHRIQGRQISYLGSYENRHLVSTASGSKWLPHRLKAAKRILDVRRKYLKAGSLNLRDRQLWSNKWNIDPHEFARLVGFFVGDGVRPYLAKDNLLLKKKFSNQIRFKLTRQRKIDYLYSIKGITVEKKASDRYVINLPGIGHWFAQHCFTERGEKRLPDRYLTLTRAEVRGLLDGLKNSDGCQLRKNWGYSSTSVSLLEQIQALCCLNNLNASWTTLHPGDENKRPVFNLHISSDRLAPLAGKKPQTPTSCSETVVEYDGFLYHVKVEGALVLRRDRKVIFG